MKFGTRGKILKQFTEGQEVWIIHEGKVKLGIVAYANVELKHGRRFCMVKLLNQNNVFVKSQVDFMYHNKDEAEFNLIHNGG